MRRNQPRVVLALLLLIPACGGPSKPSAPVYIAADGLQELGQLYKYIATVERRRPPTKLADLEQNEPALPNAWALLQTGDLVIYWGAGFAPSSNRVLAYEKRVPTEGGSVLLQDGTVKTMTAEEFQAAPKAGR